VQRKVFRVEQMFANRRTAAAAADTAEPRHLVDELKALRALPERRDGTAAETVESLKRELALIHDTIARNKRDLAALIGNGKEHRMARVAGELGAAVDDMEKATQKILKSVEIVDDSAKALAATRGTDYEAGLSQDIQDHVVQIYEACNFQDLAGQRIGNVIGTLNEIEEQVAAMLDRRNSAGDAAPSPAKAEPAPGRKLINGPKLDGDPGHASQRDIDEMYN